MSEMVPMYGFGGGGGTGATLTVSAPAGATVTVSKDGKTKSKVADSSGVAVFKGLSTGEWTVTSTNGTQTSAPKTVTITADYATAMSFFAATINITYPAGSVCTATDGVTTLTAPDTSGTWNCVVSNTGTWDVRCSDDADSDCKSVEISADNTEVNVALAYGFLFKDGDEYASKTGGWEAKSNGGYIGTLTNNGTSLSLVGSTTASSAIAGIKNTSLLDLSDYSAVVIKVTECTGACTFGILKTYNYSDFSAVWAANKSISGAGEFSLDISSVSSGVPLIQVYYSKVTITEFRLVR